MVPVLLPLVEPLPFVEELPEVPLLFLVFLLPFLPIVELSVDPEVLDEPWFIVPDEPDCPEDPAEPDCPDEPVWPLVPVEPVWLKARVPMDRDRVKMSVDNFIWIYRWKAISPARLSIL